MIDYAEVKVGDIVKVVGVGAPGYTELGDLLRVTKVHRNSVVVEDRDGDLCEFAFNCGAARLEPTEWKQDFPAGPVRRNPIDFHDDKWWFWDETWTDQVGPYNTRDDASAAFKAYAEALDSKEPQSGI